MASKELGLNREAPLGVGPSGAYNHGGPAIGDQKAMLFVVRELQGVCIPRLVPVGFATSMTHKGCRTCWLEGSQMLHGCHLPSCRTPKTPTSQ